jgi:CRISPR-associated protein Cmx8
MVSTITAVEAYHLEKRGNNIPVLAAERILPDEQVLRLYESLRQDCRNPLYRSQRILNLLRGILWYGDMDSLFAQYPYEFFVWKDKRGEKDRSTPRNIPFFGSDAARRFRAIEATIATLPGNQKGVPMSDQDKDDLLARRVYRLIQGYVRQRAEDKSGEKYENFKANKDDKGRVVYPAKYSEAVQRICSDAFLAMRGRRDKDFVEYFTGSICSVPQFLPEEDFLAVSQALMTSWDRVKTLAMLALSANSFYGREKQEEVS